MTRIEVAPNSGQSNTFSTFWQQSDVRQFFLKWKKTENLRSFFLQNFQVDLSRGLDFVPRGNVFARFTHLQHSEYEYRINVNNNTGAQAMGTCRIFMAPKNDERGTPMLFRDQRLLMIEMDKFTIACKYI